MARFNALLALSQSLLSINAPKAHAMVSPVPAGPRTSLIIPFRAAAVVSQSLLPESSNDKNLSPASVVQPTFPDVNGHTPITSLSQFAFAWHDSPPMTLEPNLPMHSSTPSNGVVVTLEVTVDVTEVVVVGVVVCEEVAV